MNRSITMSQYLAAHMSTGLALRLGTTDIKHEDNCDLFSHQ